MATATEKDVKKEVEKGAEKDAKQGIKSIMGFFNKFNNDWVMNFASALAFNLITAILPILIALLGVAGLIVGHLNPAAESQLIQNIEKIFPSAGSSSSSGSGGAFIQLALAQLNHYAGFLVIVAILLAIFGGSRLFISMEGYFDIIYHVKQRGVIKQNIMSLVMMLVFIVLIFLMGLASSIPAAIQAIGHTIGLGSLFTNGFVNQLLSIAVSLFVAWVLFEAILIVVPNQHISFRNSWLGALVAAVLLEIFLQLFPFYVTHFLGNYTGNVGLVIILLFFLYYFAIILLIGAEINAYYAEGIQSTPQSLPTIIHEYTSHMAPTKEAVEKQAPPSHKGEEPKAVVPKDTATGQPQQPQQSQQPHTAQTGATNNQAHLEQTSSLDQARTVTYRAKKRKPVTANSDTKALTIAEVAAGTALAFFIQLFQIRRKK
jgi:YihY family inner membrane protein